jgi:hypothetical protein
MRITIVARGFRDGGPAERTRCTGRILLYPSTANRTGIAVTGAGATYSFCMFDSQRVQCLVAEITRITEAMTTIADQQDATFWSTAQTTTLA